MGASSNYQKPTTHRSREVSNSKAEELRRRRKISALQETARLGIHHVVDILQCVWVDGSVFALNCTINSSLYIVSKTL